MRINKRPLIFLLVALLMAGVMLVACANDGTQTGQTPAAEVTRIVTEEVEVPGAQIEVTRIVEVAAEGPSVTIPFYDEWAASPHNDTESEAFNHWNEDDPIEVPTDCAKCHSTPGYIDHLGADGSTPGVVDVAAPIGTTVQCTCLLYTSPSPRD